MFRATALVYKFVEKLKCTVKIIKQVENKIEKNVPDINLGIINTEDTLDFCYKQLRILSRTRVA